MIVLRLAMAKRDALREPAAFSSGQLLLLHVNSMFGKYKRGVLPCISSM
jgi:hypothetical protein